MATEQLMEGTWHIGLTSLGMWRTRADPTLNYLPLPDGNVADVVAWKGKRGQRTIVGIDRPRGNGWEWRGVGWVTRFTPSRWSFVAADTAGRWAVSHFEKTPFTAAGTDVVFREARPGRELVEQARAACAAHPLTAAFAAGLFAPLRSS